MVQSPTVMSNRSTIPEGKETLRFDWLRASVASGFIATFSLTVALAAGYLFADATGQVDGNRLERWLAALARNDLTTEVGNRFAIGMVLNLGVGLLWAVLYARFAEPVLSGPGWKRGALFALLPWLLSVVVFFPIAGAGFLGSDLDAGPLPVLGNLVIHLVYGVMLGGLYAIEAGAGVRNDTPTNRQASSNGERGASLGLLIGAILGLIGGWIVGPSMNDLANEAVIAFAAALSGAAMGMLIGSVLGIKVDD